MEGNKLIDAIAEEWQNGQPRDKDGSWLMVMDGARMSERALAEAVTGRGGIWIDGWPVHGQLENTSGERVRAAMGRGVGVSPVLGVIAVVEDDEQGERTHNELYIKCTNTPQSVAGQQTRRGRGPGIPIRTVSISEGDEFVERLEGTTRCGVRRIDRMLDGWTIGFNAANADERERMSRHAINVLHEIAGFGTNREPLGGKLAEVHQALWLAGPGLKGETTARARAMAAVMRAVRSSSERVEIEPGPDSNEVRHEANLFIRRNVRTMEWIEPGETRPTQRMGPGRTGFEID